jgi:hypothetical protein
MKSLMQALMLAALCPVAGCNFGEFVYLMMPGKKIPPRFELATGPLLVLIDDDQEVVTWGGAGDALTDQIAKHLRVNGANSSVMSSSAVNALRRQDPDFIRRSIREVGKDAGADQILWIRFVDFVATTAFEDTRNASRCTVVVKVFDPHAEKTMDVRLWPEDRDGEYVTVSREASMLTSAVNDGDVARDMMTELSIKVAQMFYEYREEK